MAGHSVHGVLATLAVVTLSISMLLTALVAWRRSRVAAVALAMQSVVWLHVNRDFEGPVLLVVTRHHGFVLADTVAVVGVLAAVATWWRAGRRPQ